MWEIGRDGPDCDHVGTTPATQGASSPDRRVELRQAQATPVFDDLETWLTLELTTISGKSPLRPPSSTP